MTEEDEDRGEEDEDPQEDPQRHVESQARRIKHSVGVYYSRHRNGDREGWRIRRWIRIRIRIRARIRARIVIRAGGGGGDENGDRLWFLWKLGMNFFIKKLTLGGGKNGFLNNGGCRKDEAQKEEKEVEGERRIKRRKP